MYLSYRLANFFFIDSITTALVASCNHDTLTFRLLLTSCEQIDNYRIGRRHQEENLLYP